MLLFFVNTYLVFYSTNISCLIEIANEKVEKYKVIG